MSETLQYHVLSLSAKRLLPKIFSSPRQIESKPFDICRAGNHGRNHVIDVSGRARADYNVIIIRNRVAAHDTIGNEVLCSLYP